METFGDRLRHERESRNTRIQDISAATSIGARYLEALENNDFDSLPGPRGFGKFYIRAYAEMLDFDPDPLIDAFEKEHHKRLTAAQKGSDPEPPRTRRIRYVPPPLRSEVPSTEAVGTNEDDLEAEAASATRATTDVAATAEAQAVVAAEAEVEPEALVDVEPVTESGFSAEAGPELAPAHFSRGRLAVAALIAIVLLVVAGIALRPKPQVEAPADNVSNLPVTQVPSEPALESVLPPATSDADTAVTADTADARDQPAAATDPTATADPKIQAAPPTEVADPGRLDVAEFGVGTGVVDRRLVGETNRFEEGSVVFFFTRVVGGTSGQRIQHVWLRDGRVIQGIELTVGSAHWRTYSNKTLWGQGNWAVEARDAEGRVLARADFACVPP